MWMTIRKFGLSHCDLPTMIWNVSVLIRVLSLNIRNRKRVSIFFYVLTVVSAMCYYYVYLVSMVWFVFWRCRATGDLLAATIMFSLTVSSEMGPCKMFFMYLYRGRIREIVKGYLLSDSEVEPGSRMATTQLRLLRNVKKRAIIFWFVIIGNGVFYVVKPLVMPGRHFIEDSQIVYGLEPMLESPNYEIAFVVTSIGVWVTCYLPTTSTALLIVTAGYTEVQMLALCDELHRLWTDAQQHYKDHFKTSSSKYSVFYKTADVQRDRDKILNQYIKQRLEFVIKCHTKNLNLLRQVEEVFKGAIFVEFFLLIVGLIAELLGGLENTYIEIPFALMQVAMDCYTGQKVMDASLAFASAVYSCHWENFDNANMKTVLTILLNAQKTMKLSAGGLTLLSFTSLASVFRMVYSAYSTLRSAVK